jgi:uncharacterized membrane protein YhaH (DUF805 family)
MVSPFSFRGKIGRLAYALWSLGAFFSQHLVIRIVAGTEGQFPWADPWTYVVPLRSLVTVSGASDILQTAGFAYLLLVAWALAALAYRRAVDADINEWIAVLAIAPVIQVPVIVYLCLFPSRVESDRAVVEAPVRLPAADSAGTPHLLWVAGAGVLAGIGLTLLAVTVGTLIFGTYGMGLFLLTPFVIGAMTAYIANHKSDIGGGRTALSVVIATGLGSLALVLVALEGIVCIIMAAPLGLGVALIGGVLGREIALHSRRPARQSLSCVALLPLVFAVEKFLPATISFETVQTIEVHAPPDAVWKSVLSTDPIEGPLALPFRLGMAYPLRGEVIGEGVGAVRRGEFSTGTAIERVTEWEPNRRFAFVVVDDIPAMQELSPYQHVHAPHVVGYFRTTHTSIELILRSDGHTGIIERTSHELRLDPVLYWLPMARWVVQENNARVLAHIRRHAEQSKAR